MSRTRIASTISYTGPFFTKDVAATMLDNVQAMMEGIAREGEADIKAQYEAGATGRRPVAELGADHVADHLVGRIVSIQTGRRWHIAAAISPSREGLNAREAISLYAAAATLEELTGAVKRTTARLRRSKKVQIAELTKGLN